MKEPRVAISIVNYGSVDKTLRCLESLTSVTNSSFVVFVVDNASSGNDLERLLEREDSFPFSLTIVGNDTNRGFGGGNNTALKELFRSHPAIEVVLLLNPDTVVAPNFLEEMLKGFDAHPMVAIVGPIIYWLQEDGTRDNVIFYAGGVLASAGMKAIHRGLNEEDKGQFGEKPYATDFVTGACLLARREAIEQIGFMEEDYFLYYEDVDWCQRVIKEGWKCVVQPTAHVWHEVSTSTEEGSDSYIYYHVRNGFVAGLRWGCSFCVRLRSGLIAFKQLIKLSIPSKRRWAKITLRALRDGWKGRMGIYRE